MLPVVCSLVLFSFLCHYEPQLDFELHGKCIKIIYLFISAYFIFLFPNPTGSTSNAPLISLPSHLSNVKHGPQTRQPQPLLYVTSTGAGGPRSRKH